MSSYCRYVFLLLSPALIALGSPETVLLTGRVTDASGAAVEHASVRLYSQQVTRVFTSITDADGSYELVVQPGSYLLEAESPGLALPDSPRAIDVKVTADLPLRLEPGRVVTSITVTGTGTLESQDETAKAIDRVSRNELDRRDVASIPDGLRQIPGLSVSQRGGPGSFTTIQTRGLPSYDTSVLIDGMRFRDVGATQGDASGFLSDLLLTNTSRVEVLRGSASSLYGTNAVGGVVNVVTDSGSDQPHGSLLVEGGGLGSVRAVARFSDAAFAKRLHYSGAVGHQNVTDGVGGAGRYRNTSGNALADFTIKDGLTLSARLLTAGVYGQLDQDPGAVSSILPAGRVPAIPLSPSAIRLAQANQPYDAGRATFIPSLADPDYFRTTSFVSTQVALEHRLAAPLSYRLSYQSNISDRDYVNGPLGPGFQPGFRNSTEYGGSIDTARAQVRYAPARGQQLSAGYEFEREHFDSPSSDSDPTRPAPLFSRTVVSENSHSIDGQDQIRFFNDRLLLSVSGRWQHFDLSSPRFLGAPPVYASAASSSPPDAYTGDGSLAYFLPRTGTKIRSHVGNGYREPSLYERFGTFFDGSFFSAYGDPRLRPERSIAVDGGIDQYFASNRIRASATYFYSHLQQVIAFDFSGLIDPATDPFGRSSGYRNTGGGIARGVELSTEAKAWRGSLLKASYTYTNALDRFSQFGNTTLQSPRVTPHTVGLVLLQQFGRHVDASLDFSAANQYLYPFAGSTYVFPGPKQLNLSGGYTHPLTENINLRFFARINNAANQTFFEEGFRTPGLWATGGFTVSF